ncbi:hypothetical protein FB451DRAFT_1179123 [Mycena latifolia]|nr:hypothetical protein FB451DRAFT_1179123 [Mycena latifolia]
MHTCWLPSWVPEAAESHVGKVLTAPGNSAEITGKSEQLPWFSKPERRCQNWALNLRRQSDAACRLSGIKVNENEPWRRQSAQPDELRNAAAWAGVRGQYALIVGGDNGVMRHEGRRIKTTGVGCRAIGNKARVHTGMRDEPTIKSAR